MTDDFAIEGEDAGYVPCFQLASQLVVDEEGAISGRGAGFVAQGGSSASLPATERGAIVGSGVGFVPDPCQLIIIGGSGNGIPPTDLASSPNGTTWTLRDPQFDGNTGEVHVGSRAVSIFAAAWGTNLAVIGGGDRTLTAPSTAQLATSPDGIDWTIGASSFTGSGSRIQAIAYSPELDRFVAGGMATRIAVVGGEVWTAGLATSEGGIGWVQRTIPTVADASIQAATWSSELGLFLIGGNVRYPGTVIPLATSPDGIGWTARNSSFGGDFGLVDQFGIYCATWSPELGLFLIGGRTYIDAPGFRPRMATSPDGIGWTLQDAGFGDAYTITAATWSPELGLFLVGGTALTTDVAKFATSPDGITWTPRFPGIGTVNGDTPWAAAWSPEAKVPWSDSAGLFILGTAPLAQLAVSPDGVVWEEQETGFAGDQVYCIAVPLTP